MHNSPQTLQAERSKVNLPSKSSSMHTSASGWTLARTQCGSSEKRQRTDSLRPTLTRSTGRRLRRTFEALEAALRQPFPGLSLRARLAGGVYSCASSRNNLSLPEREGWRSRSFLKPHRSGKSGTSQIVSFEHAKASAALAASCKRASRKCARGRDQ